MPLTIAGWVSEVDLYENYLPYSMQKALFDTDAGYRSRFPSPKPSKDKGKVTGKNCNKGKSSPSNSPNKKSNKNSNKKSSGSSMHRDEDEDECDVNDASITTDDLTALNKVWLAALKSEPDEQIRSLHAGLPLFYSGELDVDFCEDDSPLTTNPVQVCKMLHMQDKHISITIIHAHSNARTYDYYVTFEDIIQAYSNTHIFYHYKHELKCIHDAFFTWMFYTNPTVVHI